MPRSVELLVDEQVRRWQLRRDRQAEESRQGVVTISRLPGARGDEVARRLSESLGYALFDREIIQEIARSSHLSERVVSALDEHDRSLLSEWLVSFASQAYLSTYEYLHQLRVVVGAIARHGGAVIVGHGAHLILDQSKALRTLVIAPREARVATIAAQQGVSPREARLRIENEESEKRAFFMKYFHADLADPAAYDLVVNTHVLGVEGAVETIKAALPALSAGRHAA
jgi:cytidylate kinase